MKFAQGLDPQLRTVTFNFLENILAVPMLKLLMRTEVPLKHVGYMGAWVQYCVCLLASVIHMHVHVHTLEVIHVNYSTLCVTPNGPR